MLEVHFTGSADYGQYLSAVIAGPPGHGKTRFCATAKDPFFLNTEGATGLMPIAGKHIPAANIKSSEDLAIARNILTLGPEKAAEILTNGQVKTIGTVIIDTVDELARILTRERLVSTGHDTMQGGDWTWLGDQLSAISRGFRELEMHVIFTCHVKDQTDGETGNTFYKLDLAGAAAHQLPGSVDLALLLRTREYMVPQEDSPELVKERRAVIYTQPDNKYEWVKDRGGKLDDIIELNFEDDFQGIVSAVYADVESLPQAEPIKVEYTPEQELPTVSAPVSTSSPEASAKSSADTVQAKTMAVEEADKAIAEAQARAKEAKAAAAKEEDEDETSVPKPQLARSADLELEYNSVDLTDAEPGSMVQVEGSDVPNGFQLNKENVGSQVRKARFVYEVDGRKILSRNQLEAGVTPILNPEISTGIFCQATGVEITKEEANLALIRLSQMVCESVFEERCDRTPKKVSA